MAKRRDGRATAAVAAGAVILTLALASTSLAHLADLRAYDVFVRGHRSTADVSNILMVLVDDRSRDVIRDPLVNWESNYARLIHDVHANGANVVAFDIVFALDDEHAPSPGRRELAQTVLEVSSAGTPVILGVDSVSGAPQSSLYLPALATGEIGSLNLSADRDETVRRVSVCSRSGDSELLSLGAAAVQAIGKSVSCDQHRGAELIDFPGPAYTIPKISFADALQLASVDAPRAKATFGGKFIFIGTDDIQDRHATPFGAGNARTPGVEVHSAIAAMLLAGTERAALSQNFLWLLAGLAAVISSFLGMRLPWASTLWAAFALIAVIPAASWLLWSRWLWLPPAAPMLGVASGCGVAMLYRYRSEFRARRQLRQHFAQYVPASVIDQLGDQESLALAGRRMRVAVLFSDIRGFTTLSERSVPEELVAQLNEYLSAMTQVINANHGIVDKFIGDGILAVFGAPLVTAEPAWNAVCAAGEMLTRLAELNRGWEQGSLPRFEIGIGIHYGDVIVGNVGSQLKMEYTVIGDTVNTASRIESQTKESIERFGVRILISEAVVNELQRLNRPIDAELMAEQQLKGKQEATRLYLLRTTTQPAERKDAAVNQ